MTTIQFNPAHKILKGEINLPASKSITNRALILNFLADDAFSIIRPSLADDSILLDNILKEIRVLPLNPLYHVIFVDNTGTAMRFLTALLSVRKGIWTLDGSERMKERPIAGLVNTLSQLGADISYTGNIGFPPLLIKGKQLSGGNASIEANTSSQYITAVLLIAGFLENGLCLSFKGEAVSKPYIAMTLNMLEYFGIRHTYADQCIVIKKQPFQPKNILIESDWSAASYWYEMIAFSDKAEIKLNGLTNSGWQGDAIIKDIFLEFGVKTEFLKDGVLLTKSKSTIKSFSFDFTDYPDIAQTLAVCCAGLGIKAELKGLESLTIKECDRLKALETELGNMGCKAIAGSNTLKIDGSGLKFGETIHTYNDHRMAMSFAPLAMLLGEIEIDSKDAVKKSYPGFWNDLQSVGFKI